MIDTHIFIHYANNPADTPNRETLQAIRDAQNGNVFHADSTDDLFHQILD